MVSRAREAAAHHTLTAAQRRLHLEVEPSDPALRVRADRERVALVFSNLVSNALRYTDDGGTVTLRALPRGDAVRFEVTDRGPGIAPGEHERVFTRFARLSGAPGGGAGLGLSIAREVIVAHGGQIGVDSEVGHGSTFWFTLPTAEAESEPTSGLD